MLPVKFLEGQIFLVDRSIFKHKGAQNGAEIKIIERVSNKFRWGVIII